MNEETILRNYLFRFLRSPNYKTDVNFYLPKFLTSDPAFSETQRVLSWEHEQYRLKVIDFAKQFHPQTATWGLNVWEEELGLPTDLSLDLELRRAKVMAKLLGTSPMTVANTNNLVNLFTDDGAAYVEELPEPGTIKIIIPSKTAYLEEMRNSLDEMLPAHLIYYFQRIIEIKDDEGGGDESKADNLSDINDESTSEESAFFVQANFPISEKIPYGSWYNAPKYDGQIKVVGVKSFNDGLKFDGAQNYSDVDKNVARYAEPCKWWFTQTGNSTFNKEFQHNGTIFYDGLRPQEIEYDDGMDELSVSEIKSVFEENVEEKLKFDGTTKFDGEISTDRNGELSITRFRKFDGAIKFDGGDLNYFDGAIKADGKFKFESGGQKAQIETVTDKLDGNLNNLRAQKEKLLGGNIYPEVVEYVPLTVDKNLNLILVNALKDRVEKTTDNYPQSTLTRAVRYNGVKTYDGGDLNYFDGAIKADGKFNFEGGGQKAKIEVVAVDLDGKTSFHKKQKETPKPYAEFFDYVAKTRDEAQLTMQSTFEEKVNYSDGNGSLTVRRKSKFDGNLKYNSYFEKAIRNYNGGLNYGGVYRVEADGRAKYNNAEHYGGRIGMSIIEYVTDLDGNEQITSLEKIPIATKEKLGFVIIGKNIEIDAKGKITLPKQNFLPINDLKSRYERWKADK